MKNYQKIKSPMFVAMYFVLFFILLVSNRLQAQSDTKTKTEALKIEIVFVLDTTGSMGGLIEGAKTKIWSIVNTIASTKPTPTIEVGLVAYRDKKDEYITQVTELSNDLDNIYSKLIDFKADGGGDHPEDVNKALADGVEKINWSKDENVLKMIYLVGDAPPHMDYPGEDTYNEICPKAKEKKIIINTVRCGNDARTESHWKEICRLADGDYVSVNQDGGMTAIATPMDEELADLSRKLNDSHISYGEGADEKNNKAKAKLDALEKKMEESVSESAGATARADRAGYSAKSAGADAGIYSSTQDLVSAYKANEKILDEIKEQDLPKEIKDLKLEERKKFLDKKLQEREELVTKMKELDNKRSLYIKEEMKKLSTKGGDAFDSFVLKTLKKAAEKRGVKIGDDIKGAKEIK